MLVVDCLFFLMWPRSLKCVKVNSTILDDGEEISEETRELPSCKLVAGRIKPLYWQTVTSQFHLAMKNRMKVKYITCGSVGLINRRAIKLLSSSIKKLFLLIISHCPLLYVLWIILYHGEEESPLSSSNKLRLISGWKSLSCWALEFDIFSTFPETTATNLRTFQS